MCSYDLIKQISSQLVATLFFLELVNVKSLCSLPQHCLVKLRCRLPPGSALLSLVYKLTRNKTRLYYSGSRALRGTIFLCVEETIQECQDNKDFCREIPIPIDCFDTEIRMEMDGLDGRKYHISRSPYRFGQLYEDQRLDHVFGRNDVIGL